MRLAVALLVMAAASARAAPASGETSLELAGVVRLVRLVSAGEGPRWLAVLAAQEGWDPADPDASGRIDTLHLFREEGRGLVRVASLRIPGHASAVDAADVDGDRVPELLVATERGIVPCRTGAAEPCGAPVASESYLHEDRSALAVPLAADLDGDGALDVVLPTAAGVEGWIWREGVAFADRERSSMALPSFVLGSEAPTAIAQLAAQGAPPSLALIRPLPRYHDLDGDGRTDAVAPLRQRLGALEGLRVHFGSASAGAAAPRDILLPLGKSELVGGEHELAFGDLDGDGRLEVGVLSYDLERFGLTQTRRLRVLGFAEGYVHREPPLLDVETDANVWEPSLLALGDADGDGAGDVLVVHVGGLRKAAVALEWHRREEDGRFRKESQTVKLPKDDDIDRAALHPPVDVDGDGKVDLVLQGEKVVHVLPGVLARGTIVRPDPATTLRPPGTDKILAVIPDGDAHRLWVVRRKTDGKNEVHLLSHARRVAP